jgi:acetyltransferase
VIFSDSSSGDSRPPLDVLFAPRSVAVIGATGRPGSVGRTVLSNLMASPFGGPVYPVNAKHETVLGLRSYASVGLLPGPVDLAVVVTPAATVPAVIRECKSAGIRGAVVISAGFKESGAGGVRLERELMESARETRMRIVGPNCLGIMCPSTGLNATFARGMARKGDVAFLSQSGALETAILDWSLRENVGFSALVSLGSMLDVGWGDLIDYLDTDGRTKSILIYMESIGDARAFLSAAREVASRKPIIIIKAGRTPQAAHAAASHTGTLSGSDEVLTAAFRRAGVLRVDSIEDLFEMADTLGKQPRPRGPRLTILTNAGGPGVLATDALVAGKGELSVLSPASLAKLDGLLPPHWSHGNPIDILGDAGPERFAQALEIAFDQEETDGLLIILTPQDMTDPTGIAERVRPYAGRYPGKPLLASWMGGAGTAAGRHILSTAGIPVFDFPDRAARIFNWMWQFSYNLAGLYETPTLAEEAKGAHEGAAEIVRAARGAGRTLLTERESKQALAAYGIPVVETRAAASVEAAVREAEALGYPVVLKLDSRTVTHKSDVNGVQLDLRDAGKVREAFAAIRAGVPAADFDGVTVQPMIRAGGYELIVGSSIDPQFGPVLLFGTGGVLVEVFKDRSLGLPPLNTTLARRMMEQTRIYSALRGQRGRAPVDLGALEKLLVRFSQLVVEQPAIKEIDINPLLASSERLIALDARIVLHGPEVADAELPVSAIRPYPTRYIGTLVLRSGARLDVRPLRPEDEPRMVRFHQALSDRSIHDRYAGAIALDARVAHDRLARLCFIDYDRQMALIAESAARGILAVARLVRLPGTGDAEFALLVADAMQGQGLGRALLGKLLEVGRDWGLARIVAEILPENRRMRRVCADLGFTFQGAVGATLIL